MNMRRYERLSPRYPSAIRSYVKGRPRLRRQLIRARGLWQRLQYLYLLLGRKRERKIAEEAMPALRTFRRGYCSIDAEMTAAFREYTGGVSYEGMPISLESACFLWSLCEATAPRRILDMGSGFSSFVFRRYQSLIQLKVEVWSVDESADWLEKTRIYLQSRGLSTDNMFTWEEFQNIQPGSFDLISHDLGYMHERPDIFETLLSLRAEGGAVVVDDLQNSAYREAINQKLSGHSDLEGYSIKWLTLDHFLRHCLLVRGR